ncbi:type III restriction-modification system restriction subunit [Lactobacillus delbrueckii]|uniref:DEAD/DEAH box helicase family protein n=1 Tax=Lactobacillus delbrueckii TaxID=1584 RepID=UPI001F1C5297|nr:DEAD/DEAH box helicase family protein [Lactobacillus delbrueckii]GHN24562.1 type III restriction-modification system restriction subunit [Lactobacillus delbrueckii]GHN26582.1 type III restriction-modification system restriction subunit [Lactobacillus delbrueckii]
MAKKKQVVKREFALIDESNRKSEISLFSSDEKIAPVPQYVFENLKHQIRPYQKQALFNLNWTQRDADNNKYNHLMFNMATGSGKTDLMAAIVLYMYGEYGYRNFLFVSNTNAVVEKTKENFLNETGGKYLFSQPINIYGKRISIKDVNRFSNQMSNDTIQMKLTTVQSLSNELLSIRENGLTFDDLEKQKIVILADEAHHFNASTKKDKLTQHTWEALLDKIRQANSANRQFEFTATIDVDKEEVYQKYRDKIIYKYELDKFMGEGYSKSVYRLQANNSDKEKMLNAVLLSQYRKRLAKKHNIADFKPVILFKSNLVKVSKQAQAEFLQLIEGLTASDLTQFIADQLKITHSEALRHTYEYWKNVDMTEAVSEIKRDFERKTSVNVNDTASEGILGDKADFKKLNTLEDPNNPIRTIFAVAKLTEGWDVLNLFDIVRIGEQSTTLMQTNSEAQLIGRGARYYPFEYEGERSYTRRFNSKENDMYLLESLYYHTINDSKYINNLHKSFDKMNLVSENDDDSNYQILSAKVKEGFQRTKVYKRGKLYQNKQEDVPAEDYSNIGAYGVDGKTMMVNVNSSTMEAGVSAAYDNETADVQKTVCAFYKASDRRLIKKAMARDRFYRYDVLSTYVPKLKSIEEFITSNDWLGRLKVVALVSDDSIELSMEERCQIVQKALTKIKEKIKQNYQNKRGTKEFYPVPISSIVHDYSKRVYTGERSQVSESIFSVDMSKKSWFVYDRAIVDHLEHEFISMIGRFVDDNELTKKYDDVYLIRNEETIDGLKIFEFQPGEDGVRHYQGFMPDFILYLADRDQQLAYQIFAEPKGDQLLNKDGWKQTLLESLDNIEVIAENEKIKLLGLKFYLRGDQNHIEEELSNKLGIDYRGFKFSMDKQK